MSTTTLDVEKTKKDAEKAPAKAKKPAKQAARITRFGLWRERAAQKRAERASERGWLSVLSWTVVLRLLVITADYLLAMLTATVVIPQLALWLHQQSGLGDPGLLSDASIAMWLLPLASIVALVVVGEVVLMRRMWRWATERLDKIKGVDAETEPTSAQTTNRTSKKNNRKRSK